MTIVDTDRISFSSMEGVYGVLYDSSGRAYHDGDRFGWKYAPEKWDYNVARDKGYVDFGDRHLGMAVQHRIKVLPGEDWVDFWTRMKKAQEKGYVEVSGSSAYSTKDQAILAREIPDLSVKGLVMEEQTPGLTPAEAKAWLAQNKQDTKETGVVGKDIKMKIGGFSLVAVAIVIALGYLIIGGKRK